MAGTKGRPKKDRDDVTVKVDRAVISRAKLVAANRKVTLAEYLTMTLESPVARDFAKEMRKVEGDKKKGEAD